MQVIRVKIPDCPKIRAFVFVAYRMVMINLAAEPDAKIVKLEFRK